MTERTRLTSSLLNLITDFEQSVTDGISTELNEDAYLQIALYYESENRLDRAVEVLERASNQFKYYCEFYLEAARILLKMRRSDDAHKAIDQAEILEPFKVNVLLLRAKTLALQRKFEQALDIIEDVKSYATHQDEVEAFLTESEVAEMSQDYELMFQALKTALILDPKNETGLKLMKHAINLSRHYEESILLHRVIIENHPYCSLAWYNLGHSYAFVSEYQNAIDALEYSFLVDNTFEDAYYDCADFCIEIKDFQRGEIILQEAINNFEADYDNLYNLALCRYKLGKIEEAKRSVFEAMQLEPYCEELHFLLAKCYIKDEDWLGAIKMLESAIDLEDQIEEYYFYLARIYEKTGKLSKANVFYRKAAFQGEEQSLYWEAYIMFLMKQKNFELAEKYIHISGNHTYSDKIVYLEIGNKLLKGEKDNALHLLTEHIQEDFEGRSCLLDLDESIQMDKEVQSIINYYEKENKI